MVGIKLRNILITLAVALLPVLAAAAPAAAAHEDECAGGIDASADPKNPTPLAILAGCAGRFYNGPGNSTSHPDDREDIYRLDVSGTGVSNLDWQLCNDHKDAYITFEVYYYTHSTLGDRVQAGYVAPGGCTTPDPEVISGGYKPGYWLFMVRTYLEGLEENKSLPYRMYAQPLLR